MLNGLHLACRTLLHMMTIPSDTELFGDKIASILFVMLMSSDVLGMIYFPFSNRVSQAENINATEEEAKRREQIKIEFDAFIGKKSDSLDNQEALQPLDLKIKKFKNLSDLPNKIPISWMSAPQAAKAGYIRKLDSDLCVHKLDYNTPNFQFSTSNIKDNYKKKLGTKLSITLEAPLLRLKFGFYSILTTSISQLSIVPAGLWLTVEILYLMVTLYGVIRYRYAKNWAIVISRLNTSIAMLSLSILTLCLAISQSSLRTTRKLPIVPELP